MKTKKYVLLFILNSFLWFLLYWTTEVITPNEPNPTGIWDLNMNGFIVGLVLLFGIHLIPFYLLCIKNIKTNLFNFFLLNIALIFICSPLMWLLLTLPDIKETETLLMHIKFFMQCLLLQTAIFFICFFIKKLYYKLRVTS